MNQDKLQSLCQIIGYQFNQFEQLKTALTHRSVCQTHNERLEFVGDSILNFVIAEALYLSNPTHAEGELSHWRAGLVQQKTLTEIGQDWQLERFIEVGPGEKKTFGQKRPSIVANAVEAIFAAIYFDSDFITVKSFILKTYGERLKTHHNIQKDAKTLLQEWLQAKRLPLPNYELLKVEGKDHESIFHIRCVLDNGQVGIGEGSTKRKAEQEAARVLFEKLI